MLAKRECRQIYRLLWSYSERTLPENDRQRVEAHLRRCAACSRQAAAYRQTVDLMRAGRTERLEVPHATWQALRVRLERASPPSSGASASEPDRTGAGLEALSALLARRPLLAWGGAALAVALLIPLAIRARQAREGERPAHVPVTAHREPPPQSRFRQVVAPLGSGRVGGTDTARRGLPAESLPHPKKAVPMPPVLAQRGLDRKVANPRDPAVDTLTPARENLAPRPSRPAPPSPEPPTQLASLDSYGRANTDTARAVRSLQSLGVEANTEAGRVFSSPSPTAGGLPSAEYELNSRRQKPILSLSLPVILSEANGAEGSRQSPSAEFGLNMHFGAQGAARDGAIKAGQDRKTDKSALPAQRVADWNLPAVRKEEYNRYFAYYLSQGLPSPPALQVMPPRAPAVLSKERAKAARIVAPGLTSSLDDLIAAAGQGDHVQGEALSAKEANPNALNEEGNTALMAEAQRGATDITRLFLKRAAEPLSHQTGLSLPPAPNVSGTWNGEDWGNVELHRTREGVYDGTYTDTWGEGIGKIHLKWSPQQQRFLGTWRQGADRFGEISIRMRKDGKTIRGAYTTDPHCKIAPADPKLADLEWNKGAGPPPLE
jgi:hypothetical protein